MKFYVTALDVNSKVDNCIRDQIFPFLDISSIDDADYVVLAITYISDWEFDAQEFEKIKHKPFVIFDYIEYGHEVYENNHLFGINTNDYIKYFESKNLMDLDRALSQVEIKCYFKRELSLSLNEKDIYFPVYPIEYPVLNYGEFSVDTEEKYNKRPIDIFFNWGWSNPSRADLHGSFYSLAEKFKYSVVSDHTQISKEKKDHPNRPIIYTSFTPHHSRLHMIDLLQIQRFAKISISLNGAGIKCFRHGESSINSLMALQENNMKWTYEWNNNNSIILPNKKNSHIIDSESSISIMLDLLNSSNLYDRYVNCVNNNKFYNQKQYINELLRRI
jgi:hypothetical protein